MSICHCAFEETGVVGAYTVCQIWNSLNDTKNNLKRLSADGHRISSNETGCHLWLSIGGNLLPTLDYVDNLYLTSILPAWFWIFVVIRKTHWEQIVCITPAGQMTVFLSVCFPFQRVMTRSAESVINYTADFTSPPSSALFSITALRSDVSYITFLLNTQRFFFIFPQAACTHLCCKSCACVQRCRQQVVGMVISTRWARCSCGVRHGWSHTSPQARQDVICGEVRLVFSSEAGKKDENPTNYRTEEDWRNVQSGFKAEVRKAVCHLWLMCDRAIERRASPCGKQQMSSCWFDEQTIRLHSFFSFFFVPQLQEEHTWIFDSFTPPFLPLSCWPRPWTLLMKG